MVLEIRKIFNLLVSVAFSSIGFIAAVTVTVLAAREVSSLLEVPCMIPEKFL